MVIQQKGAMGMKEISKSATLVLCFLSIFLFITEAQARYILPSNCTVSCGDVKNISYPFQLWNQPFGCGEFLYYLSCEKNKAILEFGQGKYYVKSINYDQQRIRVVDVKIADGNCSLPSQSLYAYELFDEFLYRASPIYNSETSFMNCSAPINDTRFIEVPCLSGNGYKTYAVYSNASMYDLHEQSCNFESVALSANDNKAKTPSSYEDIQKMLQNGFDLEWSIKCNGCILLGGECSIDNDTSTHYTCHYGYFSLDSEILDWVFFIVGNIIDIWLDIRYIFLPLVIFGFLLHKCITTRKDGSTKKKSQHNEQSMKRKRYTYNDIISITNHFREKLGEGSFGSVYKGKLPNGDLVAVKLLDYCLVSEKDFVEEIAKIGRITHANVITLVGYCCEASKWALMYDYMPNGSLDEHLLSDGGEKLLTWKKLHQIALETARGIEYLHNSCMLHLNIKPENVLLDQNFIPKVSDFGLKTFYPKGNDFVAISIQRRTERYIAPELISCDSVVTSYKSDVYSFGMLLLEMVGQTNNSKGPSSSNMNPVLWIYDCLSEGKGMGLGNVTESEARIARKLCIVGFWCIQVNPFDRPSMSKVVEMLGSGTGDLQLPPKTCLTPSPYALEVETQSDPPYALEVETQSDPSYALEVEAQSESPTRVLISKAMKRSL